jgi:hypothetical protein
MIGLFYVSIAITFCPHHSLANYRFDFYPTDGSTLVSLTNKYFEECLLGNLELQNFLNHVAIINSIKNDYLHLLPQSYKDLY